MRMTTGERGPTWTADGKNSLLLNISNSATLEWPSHRTWPLVLTTTQRETPRRLDSVSSTPKTAEWSGTSTSVLLKAFWMHHHLDGQLHQRGPQDSSEGGPSEQLHLTGLLEVYHKECRSKAQKVSKNANNPGYSAPSLLPSGLRFSSFRVNTKRMRRSFCSQIIHLLNNGRNKYYYLLRFECVDLFALNHLQMI